MLKVVSPPPHQGPDRVQSEATDVKHVDVHVIQNLIHVHLRLLCYIYNYIHMFFSERL